MDKVLLTEASIQKCITQIAKKILSTHINLSEVVLIGILSNGLPIAKRISNIIKKEKGVTLPVGQLDITIYRDDLLKAKKFVTLKETKIPFSIDNKKLIIIDDVLFHGRTIRAALNALMEYGRPNEIELAVLIDRGHRKLPIIANYIGQEIETKSHEHIDVNLLEVTGEDTVTLTTIKN